MQIAMMHQVTGDGVTTAEDTTVDDVEENVAEDYTRGHYRQFDD